MIFPDIEVLKNPVEDIATSVGLMLVSPEVLTQDRIEFFLANEYFSKWAQDIIDELESP